MATLRAAVPILVLTWLTCLMSLSLAPAHASLVVSPARFEFEVGESGEARRLSFVNRGDEPVELRLYVGYGSHGIDGSPIYFDDPDALTAAAQWIHVESEYVALPPQQAQGVDLYFASLEGVVAAYPVVYAEAYALDATGRRSTRPLVRVAIPVLVTFADARSEQFANPEMKSLTARLDAERQVLWLDAHVVNTGTSHTSVQMEMFAYNADGVRVGSARLPASRLLPHVERRMSAFWPLSELAGAVRFVAEVHEAEREPGALALDLPQRFDVASTQVQLTEFSAERLIGAGALAVTGRWHHAGAATREARPLILLYGSQGREIARFEQHPMVRIEPHQSGVWQGVLPLPGVGGDEVVSVALQMIEGEVNIAHAATTVVVDGGVRAVAANPGP